MQTAEIKELYEQKTGAPPGPAVSKFIDGLKVREVARIWSMMGEGEDFVGAIKRLIADAIKKAGGGEDVEMGHMDFDKWLQHLDDLKTKAEREKKEKALAAERERERLAEERRQAEEAEARRLAEEAEEEKRREERERREQEEARQREAEAAERSRAAQEAAEKAARERAEAERLEKEAAEQAAKDEAEKAALQARLEEARRQKEAAEEAQREAHRKLEEEKKAAEEAKKRSDAMEEAQRLMKEELEAKRKQEEAVRKQRDEELRRREEEAERRRQADEEAQKAADAEEDEEDDDEGHSESGSKEDMRMTVTIKLRDPDENLGIHGVLCLGKKVRAVELVPGGAAERAGLRPATLLCTAHGKEITNKEDLRAALHDVKQEGLTEFEMVVEMPLTKDELEMGMAKVRDARRRAAKAKVLAAMDTAKVMVIDMCVVRAKNLAGSSKNVFLECKLRQVKDGKVQSDHPNPQKSVSATIKGSLDPVFDHKVRFNVPPNDCIRISIFGAKAIGKEYKGRVDLILRDVVPSLNVGGKALIFQYPVTGEEEGRGEVGGLLEVACRVRGFVRE